MLPLDVVMLGRSVMMLMLQAGIEEKDGTKE